VPLPSACWTEYNNNNNNKLCGWFSEFGDASGAGSAILAVGAPARA
jgi:hypothetical protein